MFAQICQFICGNRSADEVSAKLLRALSPGEVAVISASCCVSNAAAQDQALKQNLFAAGGNTDSREPIEVTITEARRALPHLQRHLNPQQEAVVEKIQALVTNHGLGVFPLLLVGGQIAFYGGIPSADMIAAKLALVQEKAT